MRRIVARMSADSGDTPGALGDGQPLIEPSTPVRRDGAQYRRLPRELVTLVAVVSLGGFLFGFDTGVISGAMPYIRGDASILRKPTTTHWGEEMIVSSALAAAAVGSAGGGYIADGMGRTKALLLADALFAFGSVAMACAPELLVLIAGRVVVGLAIGVASVTAPVFIAECAPPDWRAGLVTVNVLFITGGQLVAYISNLGFSYISGTWRWMLGVAAVPACAQAMVLFGLPESPRWLAGKGRVGDANAAAMLLHLPPGTATAHVLPEGDRLSGDSPRVLTCPLLRQLHVGVGLQVLQQLAGINTIMYWAPVLIQLTGVHNPRSALAIALIPATVNALGTVAGMVTIDRFGRRRLFLTSLLGVIVALVALGWAFHAASLNSPPVAQITSSHDDGMTNVTASLECPHIGIISNCRDCLRVGCGFCGESSGPQVMLKNGMCFNLENASFAQQQCSGLPIGDQGTLTTPFFYKVGCPNAYAVATLALLVAYLAAFSPGVGPVPWAVNGEIYPLEVRGFATGLAATANWMTNAVVAQTFLSLMKLIGAGGTFWLYALIAAAGWVWAWTVLPETKGLTLEEVQHLFSAAAVPGDTRERRVKNMEIELSTNRGCGAWPQRDNAPTEAT